MPIPRATANSVHPKLLNQGNRWFTAFLHLFLAVILITLISALLLRVWFPPPFFTATGGWQGLKFAAVLTVLGVLPTLVVTNPLKARNVLARDLGLIVGMQCLVLAWCMYVLYGQRPVAVVFWESEFYTVTANELAEHGYSVSELDRFGKESPVWVYRPKPVSAEGLRQILKQVTFNKVPPYLQVNAFIPYQEYFSELAWHSKDIDEITQANHNMKAELAELLRKFGGKADDFVYLAMKSKYRNVVVVFTKTGDRIGYLYAPYLKNP